MKAVSLLTHPTPSLAGLVEGGHRTQDKIATNIKSALSSRSCARELDICTKVPDFLSFLFSFFFGICCCEADHPRTPWEKENGFSLLMFTKKLFSGHCLQLAFFVFVFVRFYLIVFFPCHVVCTYVGRGSLQSPPTLSLPSTPDKVYDVSLK